MTLLLAVGAVGLQALHGVNARTEQLIGLQRKIAAYRQVQHDTTAQLYGVATALLAPDERVLDGLLRQLGQFGYDLDRLQFVAAGEAEVLARVREEYDHFIATVTRAVELARAGDVAVARRIQLEEAGPLADRLERLTNQLVNLAEADMLAGIDTSQRAYARAQWIVAGFAVASILLALGLGYTISSALVGPVQEIEAHMRQIAAGDFSRPVAVANRDEFGSLAANLDRMRAELGRLYGELERSVVELQTLGEVSRAVSSSLDLEVVLGAMATHATTLAGADAAVFYAFDDQANVFQVKAAHRVEPEILQHIAEQPVAPGTGVLGSAGAKRAAVEIVDVDAEPDYPFRETLHGPGYRALLALPVLHEQELIGGLVVMRKTPGGFDPASVELVQTLVNQSALAIRNAELFREIEAQGHALAEASRHKSEFLANMSHELRTPLNAVLGYTELVQDGIYGEVPAKIHEVLERVQASGRHLLGLINDVLDLSKIEAGRLVLARDELAIGQVVESVVTATDALARDKGLELAAELASDLPIGEGDERRITQVLLNLVGNAIKFTEQGRVVVRAGLLNGSYLVSVADTGPGIALEHQARIFHEFQQVDGSSTRKAGGTGLGLAISRRIVELHGGRLWVDSEPGRGATFSFTLPLRPAVSEGAAA